MSLNDLMTQLEGFADDCPLSFTADGVAVRAGYHITEFQIAEVRSITCSGAQDGWTEARVQIVDGGGFEGNMAVGHFREIAGKVRDRFPEMFAPQLRVEFAPGNAGLRIYHVEPPEALGDGVVVPLSSGQAVCKAVMTTSCCGAGSGCCAA